MSKSKQNKANKNYKKMRDLIEKYHSSKVTLVAATKGRPVEQINRVIKAGITIIAENKIQEAEDKFKSVELLPCEKHFIGHLQKNKVKKAVKLFDYIQSVDSAELLEKINNYAIIVGKIQNIFLQINISQDNHKFGLSEDQAIQIIKNIKKYPNIKLTGLMTIGKNVKNPDEIRKYYKKLKKTFDQMNKIHPLKHLSMGMSADYEIALEEGSNMIRIGKALFE